MFALSAEAITPDAVIPTGEEFSSVASRPVLVAGNAPRAAVALLSLTARSVGGGAVVAPTVLIATGGSLITWSPTTFPSRGCILMRGRLSALPASYAGLVQIDDTTDGNRIVARIDSAGQPDCRAITASAAVATVAPSGAIVAGAWWSMIFAWSPGAVRFGTSAGGVISAAIARPNGLARAVFGQADIAGTYPFSGSLAADFYALWPTEAEAAALLTL